MNANVVFLLFRVALYKPIYLQIKESFISEALGGKELPQNFRIIKLKSIYSVLIIRS